jgi:hypothetical protein
MRRQNGMELSLHGHQSEGIYPIFIKQDFLTLTHLIEHYHIMIQKLLDIPSAA